MVENALVFEESKVVRVARALNDDLHICSDPWGDEPGSRKCVHHALLLESIAATAIRAYEMEVRPKPYLAYDADAAVTQFRQMVTAHGKKPSSLPVLIELGHARGVLTVLDGGKESES